MKALQKLTVSLLAILFVFSLFAVVPFELPVFAGEVIETPVIPVGPTFSGTTGDCTWTLNGTVLTVKGKGKMGDYTEADPAPWGKTITEVILEEGVTYIGNSAFAYSHLTDVTIPKTVEEIGSFAFSYSQLTFVKTKDGVKKIGEGAFLCCENLSAVEISETVTEIARVAFSRCTVLQHLNLPDSLESIGEDAFTHCGLVQLFIPEAVKSISSGAFAGCNDLEAIDVDQRNGSYHRALNCLIETKAKKIIAVSKNFEIPTDGSVTVIGKFSVAYHASVERIIIPEGVTEIENGAFYFCDSLASVQLPSTLEKVGDSAFYLSPLTEIWYSGSAAEKNEIDVGAWNNDAWYNAAWHYVDSTCDPDCNDCGKKRDVSCRLVHYYDDNQHWMQCYLCGAEMTHFDHVFDSDGIACIACPYKKYIPGDVDGSDEVDMDDAIYLLFHCSFAEEYPITQDADFDNSGAVDMDDAIYLLFYCSFPDEYPLTR